MPLLEKKVVLVTGAGPGLGKETARCVLDEGGSAVLAARGTDRLQTLREELDPDGSRTLALRADLQDDASCRELVERTEARFGRLDGVVQVAAHDRDADVLMGDAVENWARASDVNVAGTLRVIRAAVPLIERSGGGSVVVIGSVAGALPTPGHTQTTYGISKAALVSAVHYLSRELGPKGIRVNNVAPGYKLGPVLEAGFAMWADQQDVSVEEITAPLRDGLSLRRFADDADVARAAAFFLSGMARNITGQTLYVDGGHVLH